MKIYEVVITGGPVRIVEADWYTLRDSWLVFLIDDSAPEYTEVCRFNRDHVSYVGYYPNRSNSDV